jgi:transposase InsO family protein
MDDQIFSNPISTSKDFTGTLKKHQVELGMERRRRCQSNNLIERL